MNSLEVAMKKMKPRLMTVYLCFCLRAYYSTTPENANDAFVRTHDMAQHGVAELVELASSQESLDALKSVKASIVNLEFREETHIIYDIRTKLGSSPAKYLEIGTYTGVSSSLMLRHPFPTDITAVDPCVLPNRHFMGNLSQEETIRKNIALVSKSKRSEWNLIVGRLPRALPKGERFDIIFINGDHSTKGVWSDYNHTLNLLQPGGFMVFGGYLDPKFSPEVKPAVEEIARITDLVPIGTPNILGDQVSEYIFQKQETNKLMTKVDAPPILCVIVATYRRGDGSSPEKLEALWKMLRRQTFKNWKLYLTGDNYGNEEEWKNLSFFNESQVSIYDLPEPGERGRLRGKELWYNAGLAAVVEGIRRSLSDGHEWVVRLDDDDVWDADHLENIDAGVSTGATFITTSCQYLMHGFLPKATARWHSHVRHDVFPEAYATIHSSISFNAKLLHTQYIQCPGVPADACMWQRVVLDDSFVPVFVPGMSCYHVSEGGRDGAFPLVRKSTMNDIALPSGWYRDNGTQVFHHYHTLATHQFPNIISSYCQFVVGPKAGHPNFHLLTKKEVPYHTTKPQVFKGMSVWKKMS